MARHHTFWDVAQSVTLSQKISILLILVTTLSAAGISVLAYRLTKSALQESAGTHQLELARETMDKIDRLLDERYVSIQAIAAEDIFRESLAAGAHASRVGSRLTELTRMGLWDNLSLIDKWGIFIFSLDTNKVGQSVRDYPKIGGAFDEAVKGHTFYSDVIISESTSNPTVMFASPVTGKDRQGQAVLAVIVGEVPWGAVLDILDGVGITANLYNKNGILIGSNEEEQRASILHQR